MEARKIMVALDGSGNADSCLMWALDHLYRSPDTIVCVHCPELVSLGLMKDAIQASEEFTKLDNVVQTLIAKYAEILKKRQIPGKVLRLSGKPGEAIILAAQEEGASMIVTGTRGLGTFSRAVMGSVSDYVVHHATVPVVVVRKD